MNNDLRAELLAVLNEAANFVQPFNRAEALLDRIEAVIERITDSAPSPNSPLTQLEQAA